jgi:hypothetical protein
MVNRALHSPSLPYRTERTRFFGRIHPGRGDRSLVAIYDEELMFRVFIEKVQAKVLALAPQDVLRRAYPFAETPQYIQALERGVDADPPDLTSVLCIERARGRAGASGAGRCRRADRGRPRLHRALRHRFATRIAPRRRIVAAPRYR